MSIDNGRRLPLEIENVFSGICGESEGVIAFTAGATGKRATRAKAGILDGRPVDLVYLGERGGFVRYSYRAGA